MIPNLIFGQMASFQMTRGTLKNVVAPQALIKKIDKSDVQIYAEREKAWKSNEQGPNHKQTRLIEFMAQSDIN